MYKPNQQYICIRMTAILPLKNVPKRWNFCDLAHILYIGVFYLIKILLLFISLNLKILNKNWYSLNQSEVFHYVSYSDFMSSSPVLKDWSSAHARFCSKKQHPIVLLCYNLPSNIGILRNYIPFQSFY